MGGGGNVYEEQVKKMDNRQITVWPALRENSGGASSGSREKKRQAKASCI